jgi:hypothetical protein
VDLSHLCVFVRTPFFLFTFIAWKKAEKKNEVRALLFQVWRRAKWLNATKWTTHTVKVLRVKIFFFFFFHFQRLKMTFFYFTNVRCPSFLASIRVRASSTISFFFHFHRNNFLLLFPFIHNCYFELHTPFAIYTHGIERFGSLFDMTDVKREKETCVCVYMGV